jgi:hypothetical protein
VSDPGSDQPAIAIRPVWERAAQFAPTVIRSWAPRELEGDSGIEGSPRRGRFRCGEREPPATTFPRRSTIPQ